MKSCGIIVEYNPFHNGHRYHVEMARKTTGAEVVIAVMSGNFLQRGEPAIIDKWHRANEALQNGVELPVEWAVQSADYFAKGAVKILQTLDCDSLCFGTEEETSFDYSSFGRFVQENQDRIEEAFQELSDQTYSYPQKMTEVFRSLYPDITLDFSSPNHILGLSYAKENAKYVHPMELHPIRRKSAGYHEKIITDQRIASATAIRHALEEGKRIAGLVPPQTEEDLSTCSLQTWESYWPYLRYRLLSSTLLELTDIYQMTEGIESRMKIAAATADSFEDFVSKVKTKRYTWTRIQRLSCYVLLNIKKQEIPVQQNKNYLRLLGFTDAGRRFLKEKKEISIYSRIGKKEAQEAELLVRSDQIYQLGGNIPEQNFGRIPIRV